MKWAIFFSQNTNPDMKQAWDFTSNASILGWMLGKITHCEHIYYIYTAYVGASFLLHK